MKILKEFVYEKEKENPNIINMLVKDIMTMPEFLEYVKQRQSSDDLNNRPNDKE